MIKKGKFTNLETVALVATVAVAEQPKLPPELSPEEESNIPACLAHIEETDPEIIAEVLESTILTLATKQLCFFTHCHDGIHVVD